MGQTLADIRTLLAAHGLRPKHRHGQNFLHDGHKLAQIVAAADVQPDELILEVGPGTGVLSEALLEAGARLLAIEIDRDLEPILQQRVVAPFAPRARLLITDVLADKHTLAPAVVAALGNEPFKLIANLPYHVASPLLANLLLDHPTMQRAVVMVQREVADRLAAPPGGKDYGPLGILAQAMCQVQRIATLTPGCFWPPPSISSAVVLLERRATPLPSDPHAFAAFLQRVFQQRRKQLGTLLGRHRPFPPGIDPAQRPEQLALEQLLLLADWYGQVEGGQTPA